MSRSETPPGASGTSEVSDVSMPPDLDRPRAGRRGAQIQGDRSTRNRSDPSDFRDLDDTALLALLLRGPGARGLASAIRERFPDLARLRRAAAEDLAGIAGLGPARARVVPAAVELGRRIVSTPWPRGVRLRTSREVYDALAPRLRDLRREIFLVILLDGRNRRMDEVRVSEGSLSASIVHPREVFLPAVRASAAALIVAHNHPSGDPRPSPEDREVTWRLSEAGELLGIRLLDHLIVGETAYWSFADEGALRPGGSGFRPRTPNRRTGRFG